MGFINYTLFKSINIPVLKENRMIKIYNDDCLERLGKLELGAKVDLVIVDLPYGQTDCKWDSIIDLSKMWDELKKVCKNNCIFVFFCTTKFGYQLIKSNEKWFRYDLVWEKGNKVGFLNANRMPLRKHEMIYVFKAKQGTYNPQKTKGKPYKTVEGIKKWGVYGKNIRSTTNNEGDRYPTTILKFNNPKKSLHPTQKPTDLIEWLIKTYSNEGELVLDFTMGSGSTGISCLNTNRDFIGIEKDKKIFLTARNRLIEHELHHKI